MSSSGTYSYAPEIVEFVDEAFERCGVNLEELRYHHLVSARRSINLMFSDWATDGVRLFTLDAQTQTMTQSLAYYTAATGTLFIVQAFIRRSGVDTPVSPVSREQYQAIPDKTSEGLPNEFYHNRADNLYYLWNVPENSTDVLHYFRVRRNQDVLTAAETPDIPYTWNEALAAGLAAKLSVKFAPDKLDKLQTLAAIAFQRANIGDREHTDTTFTVGFV